jgi:hypothetical protein
VPRPYQGLITIALFCVLLSALAYMWIVLERRHGHRRQKMSSTAVDGFRPGVYRHYKGGMYRALMLVKHHDTRFDMVVYLSYDKHSINCRPLNGWAMRGPNACTDPDGWNDVVRDEAGNMVRRFEYVGEP